MSSDVSVIVSIVELRVIIDIVVLGVVGAVYVVGSIRPACPARRAIVARRTGA